MTEGKNTLATFTFVHDYYDRGYIEETQMMLNITGAPDDETKIEHFIEQRYYHHCHGRYRNYVKNIVLMETIAFREPDPKLVRKDYGDGKHAWELSDEEKESWGYL